MVERLKRKHGPTLAEALARRRALGTGTGRARCRAGPSEDAARAAVAAAQTGSSGRTPGCRRARGSGRSPFRPRAIEARARRTGDGRRAVRTTDGRPTRRAQAGTAAGIDPGEFFLGAEPRRGPQAAGPYRLRRRAVAGDARLQDPAAPASQPGRDAGLRRGGCRHRRANGDGGGGEARGARPGGARCCASPICRRSPLRRDPLRHRQVGARPRTVTTVGQARRGRRGSGEMARMMGGEGAATPRGVGRCPGTAGPGEGESRRQGESERRKSRPGESESAVSGHGAAST